MNTPFADIESSTDPRAVPWHVAIVWSDSTENGLPVYKWLNKENVRLVNWSNGLVSVQLLEESPIGRDVMYLILHAPFIAIGREMPV